MPLRERLKSRKFIGSVVVFVTTLILFLTGTIVEATWSSVTLTVYGVYAGSNVAEKGIDRLSERQPQSEG